MIKVTTPKANKSHVCTKCGLYICPGDRYVKVEDNDYKTGKFITKKYHEHCYKENVEKFKHIVVGIFAALGLLCGAVMAYILF